MRDIFHDIFAGQPADPVEAARRHARPALKRRFYERAGIEERDGGFALVLDGRPVRTPAGQGLVLPTRGLAVAVAAEWQGVAEFIDPGRMPLTRLVNTILDGVIAASGPVRAEIAKYLASDLLFYRADRPEALAGRQARHWDPVLAWARESLGARFVLAEGVVPVPQPDHAIKAAEGAIPHDPWRLGAVHSMTTLTGSALLALAVAEARLSTAEAWAAAHVDEEWNMEQWGRDALALERRDFRRAEMEAAATVLRTVESA